MIEARFYQWQTPDEMSGLAEAFRDEHGQKCLKRLGRDFREAYVAAKFARHRAAARVRLLKERGDKPTPDFSLCIAGEERWYETVEIDRSNRRRGDEEPIETVQLIPPEEWVTSGEYFVEAAKRIQAKARKSYDKCEGLIVWSNAFAISDSENVTPEWWRQAAQPAIDSFSESWVFHRSQWYQVLP